MAQINPALPDVLENRYASEHVGGAFDAKNLSQPKTVEQALTDATFGRTPDQSLMLEGQDTRRYIKHDDIIPETKPQPTFQPRGLKPKIFRQTGGGSSRKSVIVGDAPSPGQFQRTRVVPPGVRPQPLVRPASSPLPVVTPGQHFGIPSRRPEPSGTGRPGTPIPKLFVPTPPLPFVPVDVPKPKLPIYWDTDPAIWDMSKFIGQTFWNF